MKWSVYNQSLVRRGELLIGFDVVDNWDKELKQMNKDKVGEPFHYPNTFLLLLGYAKVYFHLPYRQTEGIAQGHAKGKVPPIPDYTTISRRINRLSIKVEDATITDKESAKEDYIITANRQYRNKGNKQRSMDERQMGCKQQERIFKNTCSGKCEDQENTFNESN
jgi:hypothetical protein